MVFEIVCETIVPLAFNRFVSEEQVAGHFTECPVIEVETAGTGAGRRAKELLYVQIHHCPLKRANN